MTTKRDGDDDSTYDDDDDDDDDDNAPVHGFPFAPRSEAEEIGWVAAEPIITVDDAPAVPRPKRRKRERRRRRRTTNKDDGNEKEKENAKGRTSSNLPNPVRGATNDDDDDDEVEIAERDEDATDDPPATKAASPSPTPTSNQNDDGTPSFFDRETGTLTLDSEHDAAAIVGAARLTLTEGRAEVLGHELLVGKSVTVRAPPWVGAAVVRRPEHDDDDDDEDDDARAARVAVTSTTSTTSSSPTFVVRTLDRAFPVVVPRDWRRAVDRVVAASRSDDDDDDDGDSEPLRVIVRGAKGVGKSTLTRYLANRLLARHRRSGVVVLDADVGQPEFVPPGVVGATRTTEPVLTPPCDRVRLFGTTTTSTSTTRLLAAVHFGEISARADPETYADAVREVVARTDAVSDRAPLVVNTDGWVRGLGREVARAVTDAVRPTHAIRVAGTSGRDARETDDDDDDEDDDRATETLVVETFRPNPGRPVPTPRSLRESRLLSYLDGPPDDAVLTRLSPTRDGDVASRLARRPPYVVPLDAIEVWTGVRDGGNVDDELVLDVVNARVVGLCRRLVAPSSYRRRDDRPPPHHCAGLGLVRGVDRARRLLYVLTPLSLETLRAEVDLIVAGGVATPVAAARPSSPRAWAWETPHTTTTVQGSRAIGGAVVRGRRGRDG